MVEICSIGSLLERKRTKAKDKYHNVPVYAVTNNRGFVLSSSLHDFDIFSDDTSNYMVVSKNDFAYNPSRLNVGSIAYFKEEGNGLISPMYVVFHADENKILAEYLYIVIKSEFVRNKIDALKEVGARFRFDFNRWDLIKIPIPSLEEQTRIVGILDTFTSAIDNLKEQIAQRRKQYEHYRDQLLDLEGKEGVEKKVLGSFGDVTKLAGFEFTEHVVYQESGHIIALRGLNVRDGHLDLSQVKYIDGSNFSKLVRSKLIKDDMLFTYVGTIGNVALIDENEKYYLAPNVSRIRFDKEIVNPKFVLYYFLSDYFKRTQINKYLNSSSMKNLSMENIRKFELNLPKLDEQSRIVSILDTFEASIQNLEAQLKERQKQYEYYRNKLLTFEKAE